MGRDLKPDDTLCVNLDYYLETGMLFEEQKHVYHLLGKPLVLVVKIKTDLSFDPAILGMYPLLKLSTMSKGNTRILIVGFCVETNMGTL